MLCDIIIAMWYDKLHDLRNNCYVGHCNHFFDEYHWITNFNLLYIWLLLLLETLIYAIKWVDNNFIGA